MARTLGGDLYLELTKESTWGTSPGWLGTTYKIYGRGDTFYDVRYKPEQETMETNVGHGRGFHNILGTNRLTGAFRTWVFPTQALALIQWGYLLTSNELDSFSARQDGGQEVLEHTGLKVQRMTIASGADIGAQRLTLDYDLVGKAEATTTTFTEPTYDTDDAYRHCDGTLTLNGAVDATVEDFSLTFDNTLDAGPPDANCDIGWLDFGGRIVTCQLTVAYQDGGALKNEFQAGTLTDVKMVYSHPKGAGNTLNLDLLTRVKYGDFQELEPLRGVMRAQMNFEAMLDPDPNTGDDFTATLT